jgi:hypothetical protein
MSEPNKAMQRTRDKSRAPLIADMKPREEDNLSTMEAFIARLSFAKTPSAGQSD